MLTGGLRTATLGNVWPWTMCGNEKSADKRSFLRHPQGENENTSTRGREAYFKDWYRKCVHSTTSERGNYGWSVAVGSHKFLLVGASSTCFLSLLEDKTTTSSLYCLCINNLAQVRESPNHLPFTVQTKPLVACDT